MWIVKATGVDHIFGKDYFPRKVKYKADAKRIKANVEALGGTAEVEKSSS